MNCYRYLWSQLHHLLLVLVMLMLTGCGADDQRAQRPLPPADPPTAAQKQVQQQLVDSHDRELALQAQLGRQATTLTEQQERVAKAEGLVEQAEAAKTAAVNAATASTRKAVQAAADQQIADAKEVHRQEVAKLKADSEATKQHAFHMIELALGLLALLAAIIAVEIPAERTKAGLFAGACASLVVVVMVVDTVLVYLEWTVGLLGAISGLYLALRHVSLHAAYTKVRSDFAAMEAAVGASNLLLSIESAFHTAEIDTKTFLLHAWLRIKGWAVTAETKGAALLHLSKAVIIPSQPTTSSQTGKA